MCFYCVFGFLCCFFFSSRRRHTRCALVTGVQTCALPISLSQIIPPSLVLIILADQLGRSIGDMYRGAIVPGFALTGMYILYVIVLSWLRPKAAPAIPEEARSFVEPNGSRGIPSLLEIGRAHV